MKSGDKLGRYQILAAIGKGGMGEVWKARDVTLNRDVAVKVLPAGFSQDPDRLSRLGREAKLLAALNHPNVAGIHGIEEVEGTRFLVLEFVEGITLAERIRGHPLPVEETLKLAAQLAEALEAAHDKGILHRDLKPANVMVTPEGRVKVLDFGLAKALAPGSEDAPTVTGILTQEGALMGTPAYMSPEQARGGPIGRQSDIWSFGVVLYEMLTGVSPFAGTSTAETLAQILKTQADLARLPVQTSQGVQRMVRRCLEKDPKRRLQHMGDVRVEIEEAIENPAEALESGKPSTVKAHSATRFWAAAVIVIVFLAGIAAVWMTQRRPAPSSLTPFWALFPIPSLPNSAPFATRRVAITPDGLRVAFSSENGLWVRRMDEAEAVQITTTGNSPFFSPDGKWIGFFGDANLSRVSVEGGAPQVLAVVTERNGGATWGPNDLIVLSTTAGLYRLSKDAKEPRLLVSPNRERGEQFYLFPQFMPNGRSVLFTIIPAETGKTNRIAAYDLDTGVVTQVLDEGSSAQYSAQGRLVYVSGMTMRTVAFDANALATQDDVVIAADITLEVADNGAADFAVSDSGALVFSSAPPVEEQARVEWIDRQGRQMPVAVKPGPYSYPRVSPDGKRIALDVGSGGLRDIWTLDLDRLTLTQLTYGRSEDMLPVWSRDGKRVYFASDRAGDFDVYSQAVDDGTPVRLEFKRPGMQAPQSFSPNGQFLVFTDLFRDLGVLNLTDSTSPDPLLNSDFDERLGQVSPDGRWIAYESDESGKQMEIFIRSFPDVRARKEQVSVNGGRYPLWGPPGNDELLFVTLDGDMVSASVKTAPALQLGRVTKLFPWRKPPAYRSGRPYDISPDGKRFLVTTSVPRNPNQATQISVIQNWLR